MIDSFVFRVARKMVKVVEEASSHCDESSGRTMMDDEKEKPI